MNSVRIAHRYGSIDHFISTPVPALAEINYVPEPESEFQNYIRLDRDQRLGQMPVWLLESLHWSINSDVLSTPPSTTN